MENDPTSILTPISRIFVGISCISYMGRILRSSANVKTVCFSVYPPASLILPIKYFSAINKR